MTPLLLLVASSLLAADVHVGASLDAELRKRIDLTWSDKPLEEGLRELSKEHRFNAVIDSRLDREFKVFGKPRDFPLEKILDMVAGLAGGRATVIGDIVFVGSSKTAERAATTAVLTKEKFSSLDKTLREKLAARIDLSWAGDETVFELIAPLAKELGLSVEDSAALSATPPAAELENVAVADVLFVLLAQADRTYEIDQTDKSLRVLDLPESPMIERTIRVPAARAAQLIAEYQQAVPSLSITAKGTALTVKGQSSSQRALESYRAQAKAAPAMGSGKRATGKSKGAPKTSYSLSMRNASLRTFASKLEEVTRKKVTIDADSLAAADKSELDRVSCICSAVSLEELLELALAPGGFQFKIGPDEITISAAKEE